MSNLFNAMNNTARTANGALTLASSNSACVDFFFLAGASRGKDITAVFRKAVDENMEVAVRTLLWLRDVRGGAGERKLFRDLIKELDRDVQVRLLDKIPEIGRWDDLLVFADTTLEESAFSRIQDALAEGNGLCAKWMPRKKYPAVKLRKFLEMTPKQYRKTLVELSQTVEALMCANHWNVIDYSKLPSVASARYQAAFSKHDPDGYAAYREALVAGDTKINAGAVYPYDVVKSVYRGDATVANAQWKALPDYIAESGENVLAVVDVSGSMGCPAGGSSVTCMDVAVSLGIYIAERTGGAFKNQYITFSEEPRLVTLDPSWNLYQKVKFTMGYNVGYSTDFNRVFDEILTAATRNGLKQEDLPSKIIALSDMEFNAATHSYGWGGRPSVEKTNFEAIDAKFRAAGYKRPQLVFWNLNARVGNVPVSQGEADTALVSGFSPAIMKSILSGADFTPAGIMLETVMSDRYAF